MAAEQADGPCTETSKSDGAAQARPAAVEGYVDGFDGKRLAGWAFDRAQPEAALQIEVHHRGERLSTACADRLRADLERAGIGDGRHAFEIIFDPPLAKEVRERVSVLARSADGAVLKRLSGAIPTAPLAAESVASVATGRQAGRSGAPSTAPVDGIRVLRRDIDAALRAFIQEIRAALGESCARGAADAEALRSATAEIAARQEALAEQIGVFEVFQARFDAALTAIESRDAKSGGVRAPDRGLRMAVAGLGVISAASLVIGLLSIWQ